MDRPLRTLAVRPQLRLSIARMRILVAGAPPRPIGDGAPPRPIGDVLEQLLAWHWSDPLYPPFVNRDTPHGVALTYEEWLDYRAHLEQRLAPRVS